MTRCAKIDFGSLSSNFCVYFVEIVKRRSDSGTYRHGRDQLIPLFLVDVLRKGPFLSSQSPRLPPFPRIHTRFSLVAPNLLRRLGYLSICSCRNRSCRSIVLRLRKWKLEPPAIVVDEVCERGSGKCLSEVVQEAEVVHSSRHQRVSRCSGTYLLKVVSSWPSRNQDQASSAALLLTPSRIKPFASPSARDRASCFVGLACAAGVNSGGRGGSDFLGSSFGFALGFASGTDVSSELNLFSAIRPLNHQQDAR